jgi:hypothetical protein
MSAMMSVRGSCDVADLALPKVAVPAAEVVRREVHLDLGANESRRFGLAIRLQAR